MFILRKYLFIAMFMLLSGKFVVAENNYFNDNFADKFLEEKHTEIVENLPTEDLPMQISHKQTQSSKQDWSGIYAGGNINLSNKADYTNANFIKKQKSAPKSLIFGYEKEFFNNSLNLVLGSELFIETQDGYTLDKEDESNAITSERAINKGIRLTFGTGWNLMHPYIWMGIYESNYKNKKIMAPKYNIEYGAGVNFLLTSHINFRVAYSFRNIKYSHEILDYFPVEEPSYSQKNYNLNNISLGLLWHF